MISEIKQYFLEHKVVSLSDLSLHFNVEESAMEQILQLLIKKDFIKFIEQNHKSGLCDGCAISDCTSNKMKIFEICEL